MVQSLLLVTGYSLRFPNSYNLPMLWDFCDIADHLAKTIEHAESDLRLEQAVYGLDSHDERQLHELLAAGLASFYSVAREVHYPSSVGNKLTHRQRCDLVLAPHGLPLRLDSRPPTLFDPPASCPPDRALWLEVKVAYQYREGNQIHGGYGSQWRSAVVADLKKMESEPLIKEAGLLLIVFNESPEIFAKDVELFEDVLAQKEVLAGFRQVRSIPILDRMGHQLCSIALWPTVQR
jgi:hypothetical protein